MRIRTAEAKDRDFILGLVQQIAAFGRPPWREYEPMAATDAAVMADALDGRSEGSVVFVGEDEAGAPLGLVHVRPETDYYLRAECGHVADLVVAPEARGRGAGRALLEAAERWARERGYPVLTLNVFVENAGARAVYESCGFEAETVRYVKRLEG
jgi:GNAT superfamily N-acetyltransferase